MKTPREILLGRHRHVEPKLDRMWSTTLGRGLRDNADATERVPPVTKLWRELIWPCRKTWAALACAWVVIALLNFASSEPASRIVSKTAPPTREEMQALIEQRRMLAQMIEPTRAPSNKHEPALPGPRSENALRTLAA